MTENDLKELTAVASIRELMPTFRRLNKELTSATDARQKESLQNKQFKQQLVEARAKKHKVVQPYKARKERALTSNAEELKVQSRLFQAEMGSLKAQHSTAMAAQQAKIDTNAARVKEVSLDLLPTALSRAETLRVDEEKRATAAAVAALAAAEEALAAATARQLVLPAEIAAAERHPVMLVPSMIGPCPGCKVATSGSRRSALMGATADHTEPSAAR